MTRRAACLTHRRIRRRALDAELVRRGLARSRALAVDAIAEGRVTVDGRPALKASMRVAPDAVLEVDGDDRYVSRAAAQARSAALDAFGVDVAGRLALDVGASTGGFTQVLLERGAREVIALDVGHGQLAPRAARGSAGRGSSRASTRAYLTPGVARAESRGRRPDAEPRGRRPVVHLARPGAAGARRDGRQPDADFVLLVKPQFEVGRTGIREGIVRDRGAAADAVERGALGGAGISGSRTAGVISSPIARHARQSGVPGLADARRVGGNPTEWGGAIAARLTRVTDVA